MKIQFIRNAAGIGLGYFAGDKANIKKSVAEELIKDGYAKAEAEAEAEADKKSEDPKE